MYNYLQMRLLQVRKNVIHRLSNHLLVGSVFVCLCTGRGRGGGRERGNKGARERKGGRQYGLRGKKDKGKRKEREAGKEGERERDWQ